MANLWMNNVLSIKSCPLPQVIAAGLACYIILHRYEPRHPLIHTFLFVVIPALLSLLLVQHYSNIVSAILTSFSIYTFTVIISTITYRLSPFHPLAKHPGPLICRLTKIWVGRKAVAGKQHLYVKNLHQKYGSVVRIGPNELSICDVTAITPMMGTNGMPKGPLWDGKTAELATKPLPAIRDSREHTRRRRTWTRAFTNSAVKDYTPIVAGRASQLVECLCSQLQTGPVDLAQWISYFSYDFMSDMAFGGGPELMRYGDNDNICQSVEKGQRIAVFLGHVPWLGEYFARLPGTGNDLKAFRASARHAAMKRRVQGSQTKDLFHYLIDEGGHEKDTPTMAEVMSDGSSAIIAGADTTSTTLSNIFYYLMSHPSSYARLRDEIDQFLPSDQVEAAFDTVIQATMPYLNAVINETLRLQPPLASGSQRSPVLGSGGHLVGPCFLPEGNNAFVPTYSIQRDSRYFFPSPEAFIPERWLSTTEKSQLGTSIHNTSAFIPFSIGPTNCVGKGLAMQEMRIVVCLMMQNFDLKFADGYKETDWEGGLCDFYILVKGTLPTVLTLRKPMC